MKRNDRQAFALLTLAIWMQAASSTACAAEPPSPSEFLKRWAKAWESSDAQTMMAFYDTAETTTAVESLGHVRRGPAAIRKMYQDAFDAVVCDRVTLTPVVQGQHGPVAWATCRYRAEMRLRSDDSRWVLEVQGSFVLKQQEDQWKIALEHFSTIPNVPRVRRVPE